MSKVTKILLVCAALSLGAVGTAFADSSWSIRIGGSWGPPVYRSYSAYESYSYYGPGQTYVYERYVPGPPVYGYSYRSYAPHYPRPYRHDHRPHRSHSHRYDRYCR